MNKKELISYFKSLGIEVNTHTLARGHQGIYFQKRIDISKNCPPSRVVPTLLHEFAHFVHASSDPLAIKNGGNLKMIFGDENLEKIEKELIEITDKFDKNSRIETLLKHKELIKQQIKEQEKIIKAEYPDFMRSKKWNKAERAIKKTKAKWLLKYDRVKLVSRFLKKVEIFSVADSQKDFPELEPAFRAYINLRSLQRKQSRIARQILKFKKYYLRPTELFARFIESYAIDYNFSYAIAPFAHKTMRESFNKGKYKELFYALEEFIN